MRKLNFQLKQLVNRNRDGSHTTQHDREKMLQMIANDLFDLGFRRMEVKSLKPKHIEALAANYLERELSVGTIKNRLSALRWWAEKIGKQNVVAKDNTFYGIGSRSFKTGISKATDIDKAILDKVSDPYLKMSLELQKAFGLRREEAIKFIPQYADHGTFIRLKASWCKGGREREVPVRTQEQADVLKRSHLIAGAGSLIPGHLMYVQQMRLYERETAKLGLNKLHGLRHRYAQERYQELTGWACPACGGPATKDLNEAEFKKDRVARTAISQELGHDRIAIAEAYLS